jgi:hypothetical protein
MKKKQEQNKLKGKLKLEKTTIARLSKIDKSLVLGGVISDDAMCTSLSWPTTATKPGECNGK